MARIKHVTIATHDVEKTAAFYKEAFGLKQVGLGVKGVYLSDGYINLAILKYQEGGHFKLGIDHLGFQVDDVDAAIAKVTELGAKPLTSREVVNRKDPATPQMYFEFRCAGPDDQHIDISAVGWVGADVQRPPHNERPAAHGHFSIFFPEDLWVALFLCSNLPALS